MEEKIEEFLVHFGERLSRLSRDAFRTQVTALIKLKESEDAHLGEEVDRHWSEVVTQQYVFRRLEKEVRGGRGGGTGPDRRKVLDPAGGSGAALWLSSSGPCRLKP